ncbi:MAG: hypothetical protein HOQ35_11345 [Acidobacteriaceae bacterium]|nr:hypothetical protein [Acidobacteriaceae bacterium]
MKSFVRISALLWAIAFALVAGHAENQPTLDGYVTRIVSSSEFEIGNVRVATTDATKMGFSNGTTNVIGPADLHELHVGNIVHVMGERRNNLFTATMIRVQIDDHTQIEETALLEKAYVLSPEGNGYKGLLWIAGYPLQITPATHLEGPDRKAFSPNLVVPNTWVTFKARYTREGIFADSLSFTPNLTEEKERKYREQEQVQFTEPDYVNKKPGQIQLRFAPDLFVPADRELQAYVQHLGESLVPAFQKQLPENDPEKMHFRFFVMDHSSGHFNPFSTPGGDIFLPGWMLLRAHNESQVAFLLAGSIAWSLQRQQLQHARRFETHGVINSMPDVGVTALMFTPAGLPVSLVTGINAASYKSLMERMNRRANRISLVYLEDQGYDLRETVQTQTNLHKRELKNPFPTGEMQPPDATKHLLEALSDHPDGGRPSTKSDAALKAAQERLRKADPKLKD